MRSSITTYNVVDNALEERATLQEVAAWLDGATYHALAAFVACAYAAVFLSA